MVLSYIQHKKATEYCKPVYVFLSECYKFWSNFMLAPFFSSLY